MRTRLAAWRRISDRMDEPELLESGCGSLDDVRANLSEMSRFNLRFGGLAALRGFLFPKLLEGEAPLRLLDVGCGSASLSREVVDWSRRCGRHVRIVGLDLDRRALAVARERLRDYPEIELVAGDALSPAFSAKSFDYAYSTLVLHHLSPAKIACLCETLSEICRHECVLSDLARDRLLLTLFNWTAPLLARHPFTRHDGRVSILRAYTPKEMRTLLADAGFTHAKVRRHDWTCRMTVLLEPAKA